MLPQLFAVTDSFEDVLQVTLFLLVSIHLLDRFLDEGRSRFGFWTQVFYEFEHDLLSEPVVALSGQVDDLGDSRLGVLFRHRPPDDIAQG